jgi:hypothetical protein
VHAFGHSAAYSFSALALLLWATTAVISAQQDPSVPWLQTLRLAPVGAHVAKPVRDFPSVLRLPTAATVLEQRLPLSSAEYQADPVAGRPGYTIVLGESIGHDSISLGGSLGRDAFDEAAGPSEYGDCDVSQRYCAWSPYVGSTRPTIEQFNGLVSPGGRPAVVSHTACCNGESCVGHVVRTRD